MKQNRNKMSYRVSEIEIVYRPKRGKRPQIKSSKDAFNVLLEIYDWNTIEAYETFWVLLLNRANRVIGAHRVGDGGVVGVVVDAKKIFAVALKAMASQVLISHNHPSSNLNPSHADINLTEKLVKGGELLDVNVIDHLIVTPERQYYSFADEGLIWTMGGYHRPVFCMTKKISKQILTFQYNSF